MKGDFESLQQQALRLGPDQRARLLVALVQSLETLTEPQIETLWIEEAERRDREMDEGRVAGVPGAEVLRRLRARSA